MIVSRHVYRRRLPHYQTEGRRYFITFNSLNRWTVPPLARDIVLRHIKFDHTRRIWITIALVMPDHVHLIGTPAAYALATILKGIKGASAAAINKGSEQARTGLAGRKFRSRTAAR